MFRVGSNKTLARASEHRKPCGLGFRVYDLGFRGLGFRGLGFRV